MAGLNRTEARTACPSDAVDCPRDRALTGIEAVWPARREILKIDGFGARVARHLDSVVPPAAVGREWELAAVACALRLARRDHGPRGRVDGTRPIGAVAVAPRAVCHEPTPVVIVYRLEETHKVALLMVVALIDASWVRTGTDDIPRV